MTREIKFRAWSKKYNKMYFMDKNDFIFRKRFHGVSFSVQDDDGFKTIDPLIPMQFTGLKDKNGKEIYEGDIISGGYGGNNVVEYDGAAFSPFAITGSELVDDPEKVEVIGNIYENPELLNK